MDKMDETDKKKKSAATQAAKGSAPGKILVGTVAKGRAVLLDNGYTLVVRGANGAKGAKNG